MSELRMLPLTRPSFDGTEIEALRQCLDSGWVTQGPFTRRFEELMGARHQVKHAIATTSCTAALHLAAMALGLGPGDEVIVPSFTWVTSAHCAEYVGAKAIFADISLETYNLDPLACEAVITPRTKAIVAVHLFGLAAELHPLLDLAKRHDLALIEDAACAIGTTYDNRPVGGWGTVGCFSFHPRKVISTGEGGMLTTNDPQIAEDLACIRNHGATGHPGPGSAPTKPYQMGRFDRIGYNLRLCDIQAAVGVVQMGKLDRLLAERQRLAETYTDLLQGCEAIALPRPSDKCGHTYQSYVVRILQGGLVRRNEIMDRLATRKIQTRPGTHAVHRLGYYATRYHLTPEMFPNASTAEDTTITLPLFPGMTGNEQKYIVGQFLSTLGA